MEEHYFLRHWDENVVKSIYFSDFRFTWEHLLECGHVSSARAGAQSPGDLLHCPEHTGARGGGSRGIRGGEWGGGGREEQLRHRDACGWMLHEWDKQARSNCAVMRKAPAEDRNRDFFRCRLLFIKSMQNNTQKDCANFKALKLFIFYFVYKVQYKTFISKMKRDNHW